MAVTYSKQQRAKAKTEGWGLVTVEVGMRDCPKPSGTLTFQGPVPPALARRAERFLLGFLSDLKQARAVADGAGVPAVNGAGGA